MKDRNYYVYMYFGPNGKVPLFFFSQTVKEKQMFSCDMPKDHLDIVIIVNNTQKAKNFGLSKVVLWNYNKFSVSNMVN